MRARSLVLFAAGALAALLFRLALPASLRVNSASDYTDFYEPVARNLLAGLGPSLAPGVAATQYPPGYPLLLAGSFAVCRLVGAPDAAGALTLGVVGAGVVPVLLLHMARMLWGPRLALVAPLVWLTYPLGLWLTKQPSSEIPFLVFFLAAVWLAWRALVSARDGWTLAAGAGVLLGCAMLVRPIALGAVPALAASLALGPRAALARRRAALAGALLLGSVVAVLPWEAWVYARTGRLVVLSTGGVPSMRDGLSFGAGSKWYREGVALPASAVAAMEEMEPRMAGVDTFDGIASAVEAAWRRRPLGTAVLFASKAARSWYATDTARHERPVLALQLVYLALGAWGTAAAVRAGGTTRVLALVVCVLVAAFWGMTILVLSIVRYMIPAMALLFLLVPGVLVFTAARARPPSAARA